MRSRQRGNAILISAILVFALTISALGVSRLLVKGVQGMASQREFLGIQGHAICEAAISRWAYDATFVRTTPSGTITYNDFVVRRADTGANEAVVVDVAWSYTGLWFEVTASLRTALPSRVDNTVTVHRTVAANAFCPPNLARTCSPPPVFSRWTP
ncbi:MAG: hypothetical protein FJZ01_26750 [Candidatus Sericytochromatia bacterium]|nr:hypothetical protein [Candidatus Tanganyikabacteria bacterium]